MKLCISCLQVINKVCWLKSNFFLNFSFKFISWTSKESIIRKFSLFDQMTLAFPNFKINEIIFINKFSTLKLISRKSLLVSQTKQVNDVNRIYLNEKLICFSIEQNQKIVNHVKSLKERIKTYLIFKLIILNFKN